MKCYIFILGFISLLVSSPLWAQEEKIILTEGLIKSFIESSPPTVRQIEASYLSSKKEELSVKDTLSFRLEGEGKQYESDERLLSNFDGGVTRELRSYSLGVVKPTSYGVDLSVKAFGQKVSNAFITDAATAGLSFNMSMDLYQNFLGRKTRRELKKTALTSKRAQLVKKAGIKSFESNLRKLYWAMVANSEQKRLLTSLVETAETQYKEAVRRQKSGVADMGEVARYHSQLSTRKASLLSVRYRRSEILKSFKQLVPELNGKQVELGPYNVDDTVMRVLACSEQIRAYDEAPIEHTPYDEIGRFFMEEEIQESKIVKTYDDPKIYLSGEYSSVGRDFGLDDARSDLADNGKGRTSVALNVSIPLGSPKKKTREVAQKMVKARYLSEIEESIAKIKAFHSETADIISILKDVVKNQKETNYYLNQSLKVSRKKYKQARISVQELISEQDSLFQSSLSEIDTNLTIINTLMDYFSIYTDFPCDLNRI